MKFVIIWKYVIFLASFIFLFAPCGGIRLLWTHFQFCFDESQQMLLIPSALLDRRIYRRNFPLAIFRTSASKYIFSCSFLRDMLLVLIRGKTLLPGDDGGCFRVLYVYFFLYRACCSLPVLSDFIQIYRSPYLQSPYARLSIFVYSFVS